MHQHGTGAKAHKARTAWKWIAATALAWGPATALAQTSPAAPSDNAPSEAARRAAMSPYRFILQNATAPVRKPAAASPADTPRRAAPTAAAEAAAATRSEKSSPGSALAAAPAAASPQAVPAAPAEAPEAMLSAGRTRPPEPAPRREIVPVRTDEPRLPGAVLRANPNGAVKIQFDINPDGSTTSVKVVSSTNRALNQPTVNAVAGWKFLPVDEVLTVETEVVYKFE